MEGMIADSWDPSMDTPNSFHDREVFSLKSFDD
jgi:hypothetical protein